MIRFLALLLLAGCSATPLQDNVYPICYPEAHPPICRVVEHRLLAEVPGPGPLTEAQVREILVRYRLVGLAGEATPATN